MKPTAIREFPVWSYDDASDELKKKILNNMYDINVDYEWWECIFDDAKEIGLKIEGFDIDNRTIEGKLTDDVDSVIKSIKENHGDVCDTYKLADGYKQEESEEFEYDLLQEYLSILQKEYDWRTSEEQIIETIQVNEYLFNANGEIA